MKVLDVMDKRVTVKTHKPPPRIPPGERNYYLPGDGEVKIVRRPGSDHSHLKSFGVRT